MERRIGGDEKTPTSITACGTTYTAAAVDEKKLGSDPRRRRQSGFCGERDRRRRRKEGEGGGNNIHYTALLCTASIIANSWLCTVIKKGSRSLSIDNTGSVFTLLNQLLSLSPLLALIHLSYTLPASQSSFRPAFTSQSLSFDIPPFPSFTFLIPPPPP